MKRPSRPKRAMKAVLSKVLVRLQRPPPVALSFAPGLESFSRSSTLFPCLAATMAAIIPAAPLPAMTTS